MDMTLFCSLVLMAMSTQTEVKDDTVQVPTFSGYVNAEVNYGHRNYKQHPVIWDFPHITVGGSVKIGKGWSVDGEFEYERFRTDGKWDDDFGSDYNTNLLAVTKQFGLGQGSSLSVQAGIVPVPLGITNTGGSALTIYDPVSESEIMPMTWHDGGLVVVGQTGNWKFTTGLYVYGKAPLKDSRMAGAAARVDYHWPVGLNVGASCFYGNTYVRQLSREIEIPEGKRHEFYSVLDFDYASNGFTIDGSAIYSQAHNKNSYGVEAGYDVLSDVTAKMQLTPFLRYDGVFDHGEEGFNRYTIGLNFAPLDGLMLKIERSWHHINGLHTIDHLHVGVGYTLEF